LKTENLRIIMAVALTGVHLAIQKDQSDLVRKMLTKGPDEPLLVGTVLLCVPCSELC
jgi:hypothetical protein